MSDVETSVLETEYLRIAGEIFDDVAAALDDCDDVTVNEVPTGAPAVNSVFALVTHLDGVIADWGGNLVAGEQLPRDRAAEFTAAGTVAEARALLARMRERLPRYVHRALNDGLADPRAIASTRADAASSSPEFVLLHLLRELAQHTGQLQVCRDVVTAP